MRPPLQNVGRDLKVSYLSQIFIGLSLNRGQLKAWGALCHSALRPCVKGGTNERKQKETEKKKKNKKKERKKAKKV